MFSQLIDQSPCRILITHSNTRSISHADWSIGLGENRPDRVLKRLAAMLVVIMMEMMRMMIMIMTD